MLRTILVLAVLLVGYAAPALADDVDNAYRLGETARKAGFANDFEVSGSASTIDIFMGTTRTADAQAAADGLCRFGREKMTWVGSWSVRTFLVVGDRPAAVCSIK
ncbi:MAG: hypothetical protein LDL44_00640 [Caenispirillum sp.]|nr:hypothetical protein [Caenispirillum sp.]